MLEESSEYSKVFFKNLFKAENGLKVSVFGLKKSNLVKR